MKPGKLKKLIREKVKVITSTGRTVAPDFDETHVHDFRVAVKILRSLLRMLQLHINDKRLKIPNKVKKLYYIAGEIREAQLEIDMLAHRNLQLPHYIIAQRRLIEDKKEEWAERYSDEAFKKMRKRLMKVKYGAIHPGLIAHFCETRLATIHQLTDAAASSDDDIHTIRKQAKDVLYTTRIAKKKWKAAHKKTEDVPVAELNKLASAIGNYNDERVMAAHVDEFATPQLSPAEEELIKSFCKQETVILQEEKHEIISMVKGLSSKPD